MVTGTIVLPKKNPTNNKVTIITLAFYNILSIALVLINTIVIFIFS